MRRATIDLLKDAYGRYALGAFNVCNLEQIHGLFRGASRARAPVMVQFTRVIRHSPGKVYMEDYAALVAARCETLGAAGKAEGLRKLPSPPQAKPGS